MWKAPQMWKDGECYIIGGGSSMLKQFGVPDSLIERVMSGQASVSEYSPYLSPLHDKHVIGVNMAFKLGNWVDVLFFGDKSFWKKNSDEIIQFPNLRVTCADIPFHPLIKHLGKWRNTYGLTPSRNHLAWNHNSGAAAINLAIHFGVKRIILLGFDMDLNPENSHWHQLYGKKPKEKLRQSFHRHLQAFPEIAKAAKKMGVEIINANPDSAINDFPKKNVKDVLRIVKIGIVIPTCSPERKPLLEFVEKRMREQTRTPDEIIKIDYPNTGKVDIAERFQKGIEQAFGKGCDFVLFIEDDDYYPKNYIENMVRAWSKVGRPALFGLDESLYYHIFSSGYRRIKTPERASAFCTAVSPGVNYKVCRGNVAFYDLELWKKNHNKKVVHLDQMPVGIKHGLGMTGGKGHRRNIYKDYDKDYNMLRSLVDEEAFDLYMGIVGKSKPTPSMEITESGFYDRAYSNSPEYAKTEPTQSIYYPVYDRICQWVNGQSRVTELGCGTGLFAKLFVSRGGAYEYGLDFSSIAINKAKEMNRQFAEKFLVKDLRKDSLPETNTVICLETLEHLKDDLGLIKKIKPETRFIFSVPDFHAESHQRFFLSEGDIKNRYSALLKINRIEKFQITKKNSIYLVDSMI